VVPHHDELGQNLLDSGGVGPPNSHRSKRSKTDRNGPETSRQRPEEDDGVGMAIATKKRALDNEDQVHGREKVTLHVPASM
jgi:hypothetical protein